MTPPALQAVLDGRPRGAGAVVTVPAQDEASHVAACLAALAVQRTPSGQPLCSGTFDVLVLANNCTDGTADVARSLADRLPYRLLVEELRLSPSMSHAGGARRTVMDLAAARLRQHGRRDGVILTTDADSRVAPTWLDANLRAFEAGVDGVAGYVDPDPVDYVGLGTPFMTRGRLEDTYLTALAELDALCDARAHDPWPNHRVASGASLAVTLDAYTTIGGLPMLELGEDAALVRALEHAGCKVRHSLDVVVTTSCRFDGRAPGGAADTMRLRHADPDMVCSDDVEPAARAFRRYVWKGRLRRLHSKSALSPLEPWATSLRVSHADALRLARTFSNKPFAQFWDALMGVSSLLGPAQPLRPSDLPREIRRAGRILSMMRHPVQRSQPTADRAGIPLAVLRDAPAIA